ncbi:Gamma-glutamylputrescine oxidoreductase [Fusarium austroafricanum]|uniref:Gamma-glutamylputrescine oxidoreductase n=1 Tax=Fusarium austroafricanum TaxID=2364996 RepID=A0A8H4NTM1_9HYPO|nr:Gamma-glutamylputrescine oxidoreductase [Fusarium austroafricanum]
MTIPTLLPGQAELPSVESTKSYWLQQPSEKLFGHRTTAELPATADVVVVGSGITGAFAAKELVKRGCKNVVLIEAREACWGATGRNGGHCQPLIYAAKAPVAQFELDTFNFLKELVSENKIPCDWETVGGVHRVPSQEVLSIVTRHLDHLRKTHPDLVDKIEVVTDKEELKKLRVSGATAAIYQPNAAKLWPYKLVSWVLERLLQENDSSVFNLQTKTPVDHLQHIGDSWALHTPRGQIAAKKVILATNAYTSRLLPKLSGFIVPVRGQVAALTPSRGSSPLEHSHVWWTPAGGDDYLVQRRSGELITGGERLGSDGQVGLSHDDSIDPVVAERLRVSLQEAVKLKAPDEPEDSTLQATFEWTGIMGYSKDGCPWVGKLPKDLGGEDSGLWVSAGYTGHGMPVAARCGIVVAQEILGIADGVKLPPQYRIDAGRADRARDMTIPSTLLDEVKMMIGDGV